MQAAPKSREEDMDPMDAVVVLTTLPEAGDHLDLARALVEERLAACVSVCGGMDSTYRWQGSVESARERHLIIKTTRQRILDLESRLRALHPYEVPEFLVLQVSSGGDAYLRWLRQSTTPAL
jgi:periplasmic divalent cation tolerance protein